MTEQIATKPLNLTPKGIAQMKLLDSGVNAMDALLLTNPLKDKVSAVAVHKLKAKYKRYSLQAPGTIKLAHNQIKRILSGEERVLDQQRVTKDGRVIDYKEVIAPSDTNIIAAACMVYDRYEPAIKVQANINMDVDPVSLDGYRNRQSGADKPQIIEGKVIDC
jgi:hypothetical protein